MAVLAVGTARTGLGAATLFLVTRPRAPCKASIHQYVVAELSGMTDRYSSAYSSSARPTS